jgi:hypothetical protein
LRWAYGYDASTLAVGGFDAKYHFKKLQGMKKPEDFYLKLDGVHLILVILYIGRGQCVKELLMLLILLMNIHE